MGATEPDRPGARPSPAALRGREDPARRVRPVDWSATGAQAPGPATTGEPRPRAADADAGDRLPRRRARTVALPRPLPSPPPAALHTLGPDDPRWKPRPLRVDEAEIRRVGVGDLTPERLVETVADPAEAWSSDNGVSDHFCRGDLVVQVRRRDNAVIGAFSRAYALAVRPERVTWTDEVARLAAGRSARRGVGTRVPTTRTELLERMAAAGFEVTPGSGHGRITHPEHPGLFVPLASTPSDVRFTRYAVAQLRRVFGIDLRT